jgi:hypothetical protein
MKRLLLLFTIVFSFLQLSAQVSPIWKKISIEEVSKFERERPNINQEGELYFTFNTTAMRQVLAGAPDKFSNLPGIEISIPSLNGRMEKYQVWENSNFEPELQAKYPEIRSYVGKGITNKYATINFSLSPTGIQTIVFKADQDAEFIESYDKAGSAYTLYTAKNRNKGKLPFSCSTQDRTLAEDVLNRVQTTARANNKLYKTLKLALSCTAEYANYFGATSSTQSAKVLTAMNATMTRVNGVMERDLAVHLNIIANDDLVFYYNASTDPYDPGATGANGTWNAQLMNTLHSVLGDAAFDMGHLFGASGGGGNAGCIGCMCSNVMTVDSSGSPTAYKGSGFTSPSDNIPKGDNFDIDYVAHEMGHQLGANHTFTYGGEGNNAGTKCGTAQVEPGSGITIMGYAGITDNTVQGVITDIDAHSIPIYSYKSISQIQTNLSPLTCPVSTTLVDNVPVVSAGGNYTIPKGTAFMLTGTATDADAGDVLTYNWEESDLSTVTYTTTTIDTNSKTFATKKDGPLFRTFNSVSTPVRYFPQMSKTLAGTLAITVSNSSTEWESVYSGVANRTLSFTFIARDNKPGGGQTATATMTATVDVTKGPFAVTSQATTGIVYTGGSTQTVTWNVASTSTLTGADKVDILLSTDVNGNSTTFPTVLATGILNNGSATVVLPNIASSTCRFMVKASANIFFAVNATNFAISALANEEFNLTNFSLYPNPNKGSFTVQFDSSSTNAIDIAVHDLRGRSIFERKYSNTGLFSQNIELNGMQTGVYLVTIKDGDKKVVKKIVIE